MPQSIPKGISAEHVLRALADLDAGMDHPFGSPTGYELVHQGCRYPPKAMRLLGQRPRYQEGPPEGAGHIQLPPLGAGKAEDPIGDALPRLLLGHRDHHHDPGTPFPPRAGPLTQEGTPDRSKLFGSHGQRPWLQDVVRERGRPGTPSAAWRMPG